MLAIIIDDTIQPTFILFSQMNTFFIQFFHFVWFHPAFNKPF
jgi:hypothetical protein